MTRKLFQQDQTHCTTRTSTLAALRLVFARREVERELVVLSCSHVVAKCSLQHSSGRGEQAQCHR